MHPTRSVTQPLISSNSILFYNILLKCGSKIKINPKNVNSSIKKTTQQGREPFQCPMISLETSDLSEMSTKTCCRHINGFQMAIWQFLPELSFAVWSNQQQSTSTKCWFAITSISAGSPHEKPNGETFFHKNSVWTSEIIPIFTQPKLGSPKHSKPNDTNRKRVPFLHVSQSCHRCWKGQLYQELVSQKNKGIISSQGALFLGYHQKKHEKNHPTRIHPKIMKVYVPKKPECPDRFTQQHLNISGQNSRHQNCRKQEKLGVRDVSWRRGTGQFQRLCISDNKIPADPPPKEKCSRSDVSSTRFTILSTP